MRALFAIGLLGLSLGALAETQEFSFDVSGESDVELVVNLQHGGITVRGYDGGQINVTASMDETGVNEEPAGEGGMRRLPNLGQEVKIHHDDGEVVIRAGTESQPVQLAVQVPRETRLQISVRDGGNLSVAGVSGEMDLQNSWGRIDIEGVANTVVAHAHSDDVTAVFAIADLPGPSTFSSWSGNIDLSFPEQVVADFRWRTNYGEVQTDLNVTNVRTVSARQEDDDSAGVEGFTMGSVNGGGPEVAATTYSGDITFRKNN